MPMDQSLRHDAIPRLSVLVPAYRYPAGVLRILDGLFDGCEGTDAVEVLVHDDSPDDAVAEAISAHPAARSVQYRHSRPARGAVPNWNALLDAARGHHVWLLHHDEFPVGPRFLPRLLDRLSAADAPDVLVLDCLLADLRRLRARRHLPGWLRVAVARHAPDYLLRRNVIGPTSAFVARRELYPRFDPALRWVVDVEAFRRLLLPRPSVALADGLAIASVLDRPGSITASLGGELARIDRAEREALGASAGRWAAPAAGRPLRLAVFACETAAWAALRAAQHAMAALGGPVLAEEVLRRAAGREAVAPGRGR
jgi:hypothetical protein